MDFLSLPPLPTVVDPDFYDDHYLENTLPLFSPQFYIPSLEDKPQDPIVTTLLARKKMAEKEPKHLNGILKKTTGAAMVVNVEDEIVDDGDLFTPDLGPVPQEPLVSWDSLFSGNPFSSRPSLPSLLTEQSMDVSIPAKELGSSDSSPTSFHVDSETLRDALQAMVYGNASPLFRWNRDVEQFELGLDIAGLVVDDLTQSSTRSIVQHFMTIGTLLRRLQRFVLLKRLRKASHELHSLVHCIDVALAAVIGNPSKRLLFTRFLGGCAGYAQERDILVALADLCHRGMDLYPPYPQWPGSRNELLDHVYNYASLHIHSFSTSKPLSALFAYILPRTTSQWLRHVSIRTGLTASLLPNEEPVPFPSFIPPRERKQIARGIKSLEILRIARPDHPVCQAPKEAALSSYGWAWTPEGVEEVVSHVEQHLARVKKQVAAWRKGSKLLQAATEATTNLAEVVEAPPTPGADSMYEPELAGLAKFDLEPGISIANTQEVARAELRLLEQIIASFPDSLPPATPTLQSITQTTVIEPLSSHCRLLSSSLLGLYLTSLHLLSHLDVLHRFMLFGDPSFVANLRAALFDERPNLPGQPAAGLNPKLSHDGHWPPGGWDLSVSLRRVVADALQHEMEREDMLPEERAVWEEAEARTGFIIIPGDEAEDGSEKVAWSDPWNIDAVRFLRLVYKPPPTLDIIITPDIIGKYQRVFDFLLSLLRVDTVARSIFLLAQNKDGASPFKRDKRSTKLLERFSRQIQAFTNSLIGYVFDSAISSHWKTFTTRLQELKHEYSSTGLRRSQTASHSHEEEDGQELHDVFSILDYHTDVLDKILTACLLKARLNSANAALRRPLNTVLALARLLKDLSEGRRSAEKAASMLVDLHRHWNASMKNLTSMLRGLDARGHGHQASSSQLSGEHDLNILRGGTTPNDLGAGDLLLRIDPTGWYAKQES